MSFLPQTEPVWCEQYDEACKYFAEGKLANEVQAQGILNAQFHIVSDLLTIIFLCLRILS